MPGFLVVVGLVYLVAAAVGGRPQLGAEMLALMIICAGGLVVAGRNETVRGMTRADSRDERFARIDLRATASTCVVLILVIVAGFVFELAHGRSGAPYWWMGMIAGIVYVVSVVILRFRS